MQELQKRANRLAKQEVSIVPFKFKHFKDLVDMHETQKSEITELLEYKTLPKIGYIAYLGTIPVAAGFLRRLEPCFAQIDTLVANKFCGSIIRNQGIDLVVDNLLQDAKRLKLKGIIAHTENESTITRAKALGFHIVPQTIIALSLQES